MAGCPKPCKKAHIQPRWKFSAKTLRENPQPPKPPKRASLTFLIKKKVCSALQLCLADPPLFQRTLGGRPAGSWLADHPPGGRVPSGLKKKFLNGGQSLMGDNCRGGGVPKPSPPGFCLIFLPFHRLFRNGREQTKLPTRGISDGVVPAALQNCRSFKKLCEYTFLSKSVCLLTCDKQLECAQTKRERKANTHFWHPGYHQTN